MTMSALTGMSMPLILIALLVSSSAEANQRFS